MPQLYKQANSLCNITIEFSQAFSKAKNERSLVDFSDLEHFTLKLLTEENSTAEKLIPSSNRPDTTRKICRNHGR